MNRNKVAAGRSLFLEETHVEDLKLLLTRKVYEKGVALSKQAMAAVEDRLERHPFLPKWDILLRPA